MIRTRLQGGTPFFPNMLNNGNVEVCLKEDVDKTLAEKDKEIARLKERICNGDVSRMTWIDDCFDKDKEIAELKQKLEDVQASMYCDVVDANMEVRRLKRALYIVLARSFCCMRELAARNALYDDECKWDNFKTTCLKKAEEFK